MESIEKILSYLDKLEGLSAVALVFLSCIVVGYVWRFIKWKAFPNDAIPAVVIAWGAFAQSLLADARASGIPFRVWFLRNVIVGAIIGFVAWLAHNLILSRIEDWVAKQFPGLSDTALFTKDNPTPPPPPPPQTPKTP